MGVAPYETVSIIVDVHHKQMYEEKDKWIPLSGVQVGIAIQKAGQNIWHWVTGGMTKNGRWGPVGFGIKENEFPINLKITLTKAGFVGQGNYEGPISEGGSYHYKYLLEEEGWVSPPDPDAEELQAAWNAQTEIEKLAMSFVSALAIIMAFKVLQGFSMERVNPVA